jgi:hypothetical protein
MPDLETMLDPAAQDDTNVDPANEKVETPAVDTKQEDAPDNKPADKDDTLDLMDEGDKEPAKEDGDKEDKPDKSEGVPEKYEKTKMDNGYEVTDDNHDVFSEIATKAGLTQAQFDTLVKYDAARQIENEAATIEADKKQTALNIAESRKEFGDKYPEAMAKAKNAYKNLYPEELRVIFKNAQFNNNPHFFRHLVKLGELIGEDTFVREEGKGGGDVLGDKLTDIFPQPPIEGVT